MDYEDLTEERKEKVRARKTPADLVALAEEEGVELTDEQLDSLSGGRGWSAITRHWARAPRPRHV